MPSDNMPRSLKSPILIRLPNWVGDVCMCLPALSLLHAKGLRFAVCARPWAQELLQGVAIESFVPVKGKFFNDLKILRAWHQQNPAYQQGLLFTDSLSSALLFRLAGLKSAGYRDDGRSLLLNLPLAKPEPRPHAVQSWYGLTTLALTRWGISTQENILAPRLDLTLTAQQELSALSVMAQANLIPGSFILIAPTATGLHHGQIKVWPHFGTLTQALQSRGKRVVMCPPPAEQEAAKLAAPGAELLPPLSLGAFAALARQARLVVCNDSGVSHLCAAVNARQLTLFGVTDPQRTGPWTPDSVNMGQNGQWAGASDVIARVFEILGLVDTETP